MHTSDSSGVILTAPALVWNHQGWRRQLREPEAVPDQASLSHVWGAGARPSETPSFMSSLPRCEALQLFFC